MIKAIVIKELRESWLLILLAALAAAYALAWLRGALLTPGENQEVFLPFVYDMTMSLVGGVGVALAALLGLKQSAWEDLRGTHYYLFHRPVSRGRILFAKLAVGVVAVLAIAGAIIVVHGLWAARPGNHPSPFFWSMTEPAWQVWFVLPIVYFAAFLSGMRVGAWYGSKLLPLVAGGLLAGILGLQPWWWLALVGSIALSAMLVGCTLAVAHSRDY